jgi:hypothetical protein
LGVLQPVGGIFIAHVQSVSDAIDSAYSLYDANKDVWTSILQLAHAWGCENVKNLAFRELHRLGVPLADLTRRQSFWFKVCSQIESLG